MQLHQKTASECAILNLPENYEQFVEGIGNSKTYHETPTGLDSSISQNSPRTGRTKQLKVSCSVDRKNRSNSKVNLSI